MITILQRWSLAKRLGIFAILGAALLAAPLTIYVRDSQQQIGVARQEHSSIEPVKNLLKVVQGTQQHRGLSADMLGGNVELESNVAEKRGDVGKAIKAFAATVKAENDAKLTAAWTSATQNWKTLEQSVAQKTINGKESYARHTALVAEYLLVLEQVADLFSLTLDPEADGYYLMSAMVIQLPYLAESLGQARATGTVYLSQNNMTGYDRASLVALVNSINMFQGNTNRALAKAIDARPELQASVGSLSQESNAGIFRVKNLVQEQLIDAEKLTLAAPDYFKVFTEVIDAQFKLNAAGLDALDTVLVNRIYKLRRDQIFVLGSIGLVTLLSVLLGLAIVRSILRQLGGEPVEAMAVAHAVAMGDLSRRLVLRPGDTSSLMAAMAKMQAAIYGFVAGQSEMKKQHDAGAISYRIPVTQFSGSYREMA